MAADAFLRVSVGQLGNKALVDARLVGTRTSAAIAAVNLGACDGSEEATEAAVTAALVNLFSQAGLRHTLQSKRVTSCGQEPPTAQTEPATPSTSARTSRPWPALVVAGSGAVLL